MVFDSAWISTEDHLKRVQEVLSGRPFLTLALGLCDLPGDLPHLRPFWGLLPFRFPVVAIANGQMRVDEQGIHFQARPLRLLGNRARNLLDDLAFQIPAGEIVTIRPSPLASPLLSYYDMPFTRIEARRQGLLKDFLVCIGGAGPLMGAIRRLNDRLFLALSQLVGE